MTTYYLAIDALIEPDGTFQIFDIAAYSVKANRDAAPECGNYTLDLEVDKAAIAVKDRLLGRSTTLHTLWWDAAIEHMKKLAAEKRQ